MTPIRIATACQVAAARRLAKTRRQGGPPVGRINERQFRTWLTSEGARGIVADAIPPPPLCAAVAQSRLIVVSSLERAQQTADTTLATVGPSPNRVVVRMDALREAPLPAVRIPYARLSLGAWALIARAAWALGFSGGVESGRSARDRARRAAIDLDRLSRDTDTGNTGDVVVVAHGIFNVMLARQLRRLGWRGPRRPRHHHGSVTAYVSPP